MGVELRPAQGGVDHLLDATFEDDFAVLSPNHPAANAEGELAVQAGDHIPGIPENVVKLGGDWRFIENGLIGLEVIHNSSQVMRGDESNQLDTIDGYTLVNLSLTRRFANLRVTAYQEDPQKPIAMATTVRVQDGRTLTTDGPFPEAKEQIGGFWIIEAENLDEAMDWAAQATVACRGPVEIRPFQDEPEA